MLDGLRSAVYQRYVCGSSIKFLRKSQYCCIRAWTFGEVYGGCGGTLQKSILFTPRDPNAGPTGGDGDAWPAPTISLTIWFEVRFLRAMFQEFEDVESAGTCVGCSFVRLWVADVSFSGYVSGVTTKG